MAGTRLAASVITASKAVAAASVAGFEGRHAVEARRDGLPRQSGRGEACGKPAQRDRERAAQDQGEHAAGVGAEREADAELAPPLADRARHHAVDADRGEQRRDGGKDSRQPREQPGCSESARSMAVAYGSTS